MANVYSHVCSRSRTNFLARSRRRDGLRLQKRITDREEGNQSLGKQDGTMQIFNRIYFTLTNLEIVWRKSLERVGPPKKKIWKMIRETLSTLRFIHHQPVGNSPTPHFLSFKTRIAKHRSNIRDKITSTPMAVHVF